MTDQVEWAAARDSREQEPTSKCTSSRAQRLVELLEHDTFESLAFSRARLPDEPEYVFTKLRAGVR